MRGVLTRQAKACVETLAQCVDVTTTHRVLAQMTEPYVQAVSASQSGLQTCSHMISCRDTRRAEVLSRDQVPYLETSDATQCRLGI